jgi:hypothetical protein
MLWDNGYLVESVAYLRVLHFIFHKSVTTISPTERSPTDAPYAEP